MGCRDFLIFIGVEIRFGRLGGWGGLAVVSRSAGLRTVFTCVLDILGLLSLIGYHGYFNSHLT